MPTKTIIKPNIITERVILTRDEVISLGINKIELIAPTPLAKGPNGSSLAGVKALRTLIPGSVYIDKSPSAGFNFDLSSQLIIGWGRANDSIADIILYGVYAVPAVLFCVAAEARYEVGKITNTQRFISDDVSPSYNVDRNGLYLVYDNNAVITGSKGLGLGMTIHYSYIDNGEVLIA